MNAALLNDQRIWMEFARLAKRYSGNAAEKYDCEREQTEKWGREQSAVESILSSIPPGSILDIPVGTGRFVELYRRYGLQATGVDISDCMLSKAAAKAKDLKATIVLREGDIREIPAADRSFDIVLCIRFLNWVDLEGVQEALSELIRVCNRYLIVSISHFVPLREINFASRPGIRSLLGQAARRFKIQIMRHGRKNRIIFHEKHRLDQIFANFGLHVSTTICTEPGSRGVATFVYLLECHGLRRAIT